MQHAGLRSLGVIILVMVLLLFGQLGLLVSSLCIFAHFLLHLRDDSPPVIFPVDVQNVNARRFDDSCPIP